MAISEDSLIALLGVGDTIEVTLGDVVASGSEMTVERLSINDGAGRILNFSDLNLTVARGAENRFLLDQVKVDTIEVFDFGTDTVVQIDEIAVSKPGETFLDDIRILARGLIGDETVDLNALDFEVLTLKDLTFTRQEDESFGTLRIDGIEILNADEEKFESVTFDEIRPADGVSSAKGLVMQDVDRARFVEVLQVIYSEDAEQDDAFKSLFPLFFGRLSLESYDVEGDLISDINMIVERHSDGSLAKAVLKPNEMILNINEDGKLFVYESDDQSGSDDDEEGLDLTDALPKPFIDALGGKVAVETSFDYTRTLTGEETLRDLVFGVDQMFELRGGAEMTGFGEMMVEINTLETIKNIPRIRNLDLEYTDKGLISALDEGDKKFKKQMRATLGLAVLLLGGNAKEVDPFMENPGRIILTVRREDFTDVGDLMGVSAKGSDDAEASKNTTKLQLIPGF